VKNRIYKILSIILSISLIFSVCAVSTSATATAVNNYYVKKGGTGDGTSPDSPVATVYDAITKINSDGLDADDTANIYIMQVDEPRTLNEDGISHNMTVWSNTLCGDWTWSNIVPAHTAHIVVQAYEYNVSNPTYLASNPEIAEGRHFRLAGPTTFKNIYIVSDRYDGRIDTDGYAVTFDEGVSFGRIPMYGFTSGNSWDGYIEKADSVQINAGAFAGEKTIETATEMIFNSAFISGQGADGARNIYLANRAGAKNTFTEDYNITFNSATSAPVINLGGTSSGQSIYEKNLNINMISGSALTMTAGSGTVTANAIQIITNGAVSYSGDVSSFSNVTTAKGVWVVSNKTGTAELLSFTDTAGTFTVKDGAVVIATDEDGNEVKSSGDTLVLPAGKYTVTNDASAVEPKVGNYYVKYGGTGDGTSEESPVATVYDAIAKANDDGLSTGDIANIYIMQVDEPLTYDATAMTHRMTAWSTTYESTNWSNIVPNHDATVVIQAFDKDVTTYLASNSQVAVGRHFRLGGPTIFKSIYLVVDRYDARIDINGHSVTFHEGVSFGRIPLWSFNSSEWDGYVEKSDSLATLTGTYTGTQTIENKVNIVFNSKFVSAQSVDRARYLYIASYGGGAAYTYEKDMNITFNHSESVPVVQLGDSASGQTTFNKNLNFNMMAGKSLTFVAGTGKVTAKNIQILTSGGSYVNGEVSEFTNVVADGIWNITNKSEYSDLIEFTNVAGTYTVKDGVDVIATSDSGAEYTSRDGKLVLPEGVYTVTNYEAPVTSDFYVMYGAAEGNDGKTRETPVATVKDAIELINAEGLTSNDIANIYIIHRDDYTTYDTTTFKHQIATWSTDIITSADGSWGYSNVVPEHEAKIVIQADDVSKSTYLAYGPTLGDGGNLRLGGPTTFKNITIVGMNFNSRFEAAGNDVTFEETAKFALFARYGMNANVVWDGTFSEFDALKMHTGSYNVTKEVSENQNIVFNNKFVSDADFEGSATNIYIAAWKKSAYTYNQNLNIIFNNSESEPIVQLGNTESDATVIEKNLNINMKSGKSLTVTSGTGEFTVNGGIQIITSSGAVYSGDISSFKNVTSAKGVWTISNTSADDELLAYTSTAGRYAVKDGYAVTAINTATGEKTYSSEGYLELTAGNYTVSAVKTGSYYVLDGASANNDGLTPETPVPSVADAVRLINSASFGENDVANIYIMQRSDWATNTGTAHNMTVWGEYDSSTNSNTTVPDHVTQIVVQAYDYDESNPTYLAFEGTLGSNKSMALGGPTTFKNITLVGTRKEVRIDTMGNSVTFGENVKYGYLNAWSFSEASTWDGSLVVLECLRICMGHYAGGKTIETEVNMTFDSAFITSGDTSNYVYLDNSGPASYTYNEDVNITFNNSASEPTVKLGSNSGTATLKKNLNIYMATGEALNILAGNGAVAVNGGIQIVTNNGVAYLGDFSTFTNVTAAKGIWIVNVTTEMESALLLTDNLGEYKVADGYIALATDSAGNEFYSVDGVLKLDAGQYAVQVVDNYINKGDSIEILDTVTIDLANEEHTSKTDKLFIGWVKADGSYAEQTAVYTRGDVLTAVYVDFKAEDFAITDTEIKTSNGIGLRFVVSQSKAFVDAIPNVAEYGTITLPTEIAGGRDIFLDTPVVIEWQWDADDKNNFTPKTTGETPIKVIAENILEESETDRKYTLCITGIENDKFNVFYTARGYIKFVDYNGFTRVVYTDDAQNSLYKLAKETTPTTADSALYSSIIAYVENVWETKYLNELNSKVTYLSGYDTTVDTDPNHKIYSLSNGLVVRDVTINSGFDKEKTEICFFTDSHFNYVNETDIANKDIYALSSYRGRSWLRNGSSIDWHNKIWKYASTFEKIVNGGDAVDYLSAGSLSVTENLMTKMSINNNLLMAFGNHETSESMQADTYCPDLLSLAEKYDLVSKYWTNDPYYVEDIVNGASGNPKVMLVVMDNAREFYHESQIDKLNTSVEKARELNIPILIFQHVPMLTFNPNETAVKVSGGTAGSFYTNNTETIDFTTYNRFVGHSGSDDATKEIIRIIRSNSDVIKGVFDGHWHQNMYTEIAAIDENGDLLYDENGNLVVIPQHSGYGAHYGGVMKITVQ